VIRSGWRNVPLRRLLLVSAAALLPVLAGCEAGTDAPTLDFHYPTDAAGTVAGDISIRNVFIVGAPLGSSLKPGESASLFFSLINNGAPDRLLSITAPGSASSVKLTGGTVPVVAMHPVYFNGPQPEAYLFHLTRVITGGSDLTLDLFFQNEGKVTLQVPVFAATAHYATYSPPPSPTATATTASKHKHGASGSSPTPTPSPTPTT
jgi:copper(I)-binding protein